MGAQVYARARDADNQPGRDRGRDRQLPRRGVTLQTYSLVGNEPHMAEPPRQPLRKYALLPMVFAERRLIVESTCA